ncbi:MAG: substrate-binding domain-containing protein [Treponema sp.]|nr:substrate-binding domain-containing protein [Treponema sp.]
MKKVTVIMFVLIIGLTLTACGGRQTSSVSTDADSANRGAGETYAVVASLGQPEFFDALKSGVYTACEEIGAAWYITGPQDMEPDRLVQAIDQAVSNNVTGIILHGQMPETAEAINNAVDAGVPVIIVNTDIPSKRLSFLGCGPYQVGYDMGTKMVEILNGKAGTVVVSFAIAHPSSIEIAEGIHDVLERLPGIRVVDVDDTADANIAATNNGAALQAYPDVVGMIGVMAYSSVGICTAIREVDKIGQIVVIGRDRDAATLELIENGEMAASYAQNSFVEAYIATMWLHDYVNGNLKVIDDYLGAKVNPLPKVVDSGSIIIDKSNYKQFMEPYKYVVTARN